MGDAVIVSTVRTAVGTMGGGLSTITAPKLGAVTIAEAIKRAGIPENLFPDEVLMGNVIQAGIGQNPARQAAIESGLPVSVPATTISIIFLGFLIESTKSSRSEKPKILLFLDRLFTKLSICGGVRL